jgi:hypothetical protein
MGASSVTGVGYGSVEGQNKGSKHWTVGTGRLIGPRVVAAGTATLTSGAATVTLPALPSGSYVVLVTDTNASATAVSGSVVNTVGTSCVVTLAGTGSHVLAWAIVKTGKEV